MSDENKTNDVDMDFDFDSIGIGSDEIVNVDIGDGGLETIQADKLLSGLGASKDDVVTSKDGITEPVEATKVVDTLGILKVSEVEAEEKLEETVFENVSFDVDSVVLGVRETVDFFATVGLFYKGGTDVYTRSVLLRREKDDEAKLIYSDSLIYCEKTFKVPSAEKKLCGSFVIDADSLIKLFRITETQIPLVKTGDDVFMRLFGGDLYLLTHGVSQEFYKESELGAEISSISLDAQDFLEKMRVYYLLSSKGSTAEERAVYFDKDQAYVYSGNVFGKFVGEFLETIFQTQDIQAINTFFRSAKGNIILSLYDNHVTVSIGEDRLVFLRKNLNLSEEVKNYNLKVNNGVTVSVDQISKILRVLEASPSSANVVELQSVEGGLQMVSTSKSEKSASEFMVKADKIGTGFNEKVSISVHVLYSYLVSFKGQIDISVRSNNLYLNGNIGDILIAGV